MGNSGSSSSSGKDSSWLSGESSSTESGSSKSGFLSMFGDSSSGSSDSSSSGSSSSDSSGTSSSNKKSGFFNMFKDSKSSTSDSRSGSSSDSSEGSSSGSSDSSGDSSKSGPGLFDKMFGNEKSSDSSKSSSSNLMNSVLATLQGNSYLERFVFVVLVVICFVVLLSIGSNILSAIFEPNNPYFVDGLYTASNSKIIPVDPTKSGAIPISRSDNESYGIEFSWSVWLNVTSLDDSPGNAGQYKHVFSKGDNDNVPMDSRGLNSPNNSPGLYIDKNTNSLVVIMNTFEQIEEMITVVDVPLNKWVHVLIRVEGAFFDVYINGTLAKRKVLASVPKQNNGNVYICQNGGFSGFISNLRYYRNALDPGDILRIVRKGPSLKVSSLEKKDLKSGNLDYLAMDWYFHNAR
jgi:hypothetical protein